MSQQAVKISEDAYEAVKDAASINSRSISGQAEHWIRLGRALERNPEIAYTRIERALRGMMSVEDLSGDEQDEFFDKFADKMGDVSESERAYFAGREERGLGVGMDDAGALTYSPNARRN